MISYSLGIEGLKYYFDPETPRKDDIPFAVIDAGKIKPKFQTSGYYLCDVPLTIDVYLSPKQHLSSNRELARISEKLVRSLIDNAKLGGRVLHSEIEGEERLIIPGESGIRVIMIEMSIRYGMRGAASDEAMVPDNWTMEVEGL